jgi:hypothetical protein
MSAFDGILSVLVGKMYCTLQIMVSESDVGIEMFKIQIM